MTPARWHRAKRGRRWPPLRLTEAVAELSTRFGADPGRWQWGELHAVTPLHALRTQRWATRCARPPVPSAGPRAVSMATNQLGGMTSNALTGSVARYLWDLADPNASGWIVPLGASGDPGTRTSATRPTGMSRWSSSR